MVDEVEIKITADASDAKKALRDTDFYIKALKEDTELLKDIQVEYKEALAETGGKLTGKALKLHEKILDIKASIAKSEREIEKAGKGQEKSQTKLLKGMNRAFGGKLKALAGLGLIAGGVYALKSMKDSAISTARETRSQYLSSIATGMTSSAYSGLAGSAASSGIEERNLNAVLSNINSSLISLQTGKGSAFQKLIELQNWTGIPLTNANGSYKTQKQILEEIQKWVKTQRKDVALEILSPLGFTADLINEMHDGNIVAEKNLGLTEDQIKANNELSKSTSNLGAETKKLGGVLTSTIAPTLSELNNGLSGFIHWTSESITEAQKNAKTTKRAVFGNEQRELTAKIVRGLPEERRDIYIKKNLNKTRDELTSEEYMLYFGDEKDIKKSKRLRELIAKEKALISTGKGSQKFLDIWEKSYERQYLVKYKADREMTPIPKELLKQRKSGKQMPFDKERQWETLYLSQIPEKASSLTGGQSLKNIEQNADVEINIYGEANPEQTKDAVETGITNGFQETQQQVVGG